MNTLSQIFYALGDFCAGKVRVIDIATQQPVRIIVNNGVIEVEKIP